MICIKISITAMLSQKSQLTTAKGIHILSKNFAEKRSCAQNIAREIKKQKTHVFPTVTLELKILILCCLLAMSTFFYNLLYYFL